MLTARLVFYLIRLSTSGRNPPSPRGRLKVPPPSRKALPFALFTLHSAFCTLCSAFCTLHSAFCTLHSPRSAFCTLHSRPVRRSALVPRSLSFRARKIEDEAANPRRGISVLEPPWVKPFRKDSFGKILLLKRLKGTRLRHGDPSNFGIVSAFNPCRSG